MVDSTAHAEALNAEDYVSLVKSFQANCSEAAAQFGGYVAQYLGDGLLIYFGYPVTYEDSSRRAVLSAIAAIEAIKTLNSGGTAGGRSIAARIGIHVGMTVAAEVGIGTFKENLTLGQVPIVAARIQGLAEPGTIVVSDALRQLVQGHFTFRDLGPHKLKGLIDHVHLFLVTGVTPRSRFDASTVRGLTPFVGRRSELAELERLWDEVQTGTAATVLIRGDAGIGKSRLTRRFTELVATAAQNVTKLEASRYHVNTMLFPVIELFNRHVLTAPNGDDASARLRPLEEFLAMREVNLDKAIPLLGSLLDIPFGPHYTLN